MVIPPVITAPFRVTIRSLNTSLRVLSTVMTDVLTSSVCKPEVNITELKIFEGASRMGKETSGTSLLKMWFLAIRHDTLLYRSWLCSKVPTLRILQI